MNQHLGSPEEDNGGRDRKGITGVCKVGTGVEPGTRGSGKPGPGRAGW